ncbi:MAG TPA: SGNH/GDSL hydrolase family protein [Methylomirabilota bacterium]|nr:SGNH/GDSL hydrolase family protein [Methylomirabilota bacterium]
MVKPIGLAIVAMLVLTAGAWAGAAGMRMLPADLGAEVVYVALGDSTVEGVGASTARNNYVGRLDARLRDRYPRARTVNLGVAGATSLDVLDAQLARAIAFQPHLVTLSIGPNDITTRVPPATYARNLDTILARLARETSAVIVVNLLPDLAITPRFRNRDSAPVVGRLSVEFNNIVARTAKRHGALVVDLYRASRREVPGHPELLSADGYHPSDLGYARWAELMWDAVRTRIGS